MRFNRRSKRAHSVRFEGQIILHTRGVMPSWRIVSFRDCMSFCSVNRGTIRTGRRPTSALSRLCCKSRLAGSVK